MIFLADAPCEEGPITITTNTSLPGGGGASWALFKAPNIVYAVNENSNTVHRFTFDKATNSLAHQEATEGSSGTVHLELTSDGNHMLGAAFGAGMIDVYSVAEDGVLGLVKSIPSTGELGPKKPNQNGPHPHQVAREGSGRFFFAPDLGTDKVLVIDSQNDFNVTTQHQAPAGCGPRHGSFLSLNGEEGLSSHYVLVCELTSTLILYSLDFSTEGTVVLTQLQETSTYGVDFPPANATTAAAGEIAISNDNKSLYVSNRLTGNDTDSLSFFSVSGTGADVRLAFAQAVPSGGAVPRMFSLSIDAAQETLYVANQNAGVGLRKLGRAETGVLGEPLQDLPIDAFSAAGFGPQFVQEVDL